MNSINSNSKNNQQRSFKSESKEIVNVGIVPQEKHSQFNDTTEENNIQQKSYQNQEVELKLDDVQRNINEEIDSQNSQNATSNQGGVQSEFVTTNEGGLMDYSDVQDGDDESGDIQSDEDDDERFIREELEEDDEERFIKKEGVEFDLSSAGEQIMQDIVTDLDEYHQSVEGVRPIKNKNRSLAHEHGGLEVKEHDGKSEEDVWDDRSEQVTEMGEDAYESMNSASSSSIRKSFIHRKKQEKKRKKRRDEIDEEMEEGSGLSLLEARKESKSSHVDRLESQRSSDATRGGGDIFGGIGF